MNIQIQCCGLAILICLLFYYFRQKKVGLYTENIFISTLFTTLGCIILEIALVITVGYGKYMAPVLAGISGGIVIRLYEVSLVVVAFLGMIYSLTEVYSEQKFLQLIRKLVFVLIFAGVIVCALPVEGNVNGGRVDLSGIGSIVTYVFALGFICATIYNTIRYGKYVSQRRKIAVIIWMTLWIFGAAIQFFSDCLGVIGFSGTLGMMTLFFTLENPQSNIDRQFGCFHSHAMMAYLNQCFERNVSRSILLISMSGYQVEGMENETIDNSLRVLIRYMENMKGVKVFKSVEQELIVTFEDSSEMALIYQQIQDTFYVDQYYQESEDKEMTVFPRTLFVLLPDSLIMKDAKEILRLYQQIKADNRDNNNSQVCYVDQGILDRLREREAIRIKIIQALRDDRVEVLFQPIYSNKEKRFISAEALVRIRYKDGTLMSPGKFISVAEDSGMILQLGERVFEKTCQFLQKHDIRKLGMRYMEINLSVIQCEMRDLADRFIRIMEHYKIDPWLINLEITETGSVQTKMYLMKNMKQLIDYGVSFSLDDFGNGQSNLDYMIDMPISIVKLDMNMTAVYFKDLKARFVVLATIRMAHEMDLMIVAEGIETEEQVKEMQAQGIDFIQGYYFSRPLPEDEFVAFMKEHNK